MECNKAYEEKCYLKKSNVVFSYKLVIVFMYYNVPDLHALLTRILKNQRALANNCMDFRRCFTAQQFKRN